MLLVWGERDIGDERNLKVLGVFATQADARRRVDKALTEPGFPTTPTSRV